MFTRLINSIRDQLAAHRSQHSDRNASNGYSNDSANMTNAVEGDPPPHRSRSSSVTEELQRRSSIGSSSIFTNDGGVLTRYTTAQSVPIPRKNSISTATTGGPDSENGRRNSTTLYGVSNKSAYDDYVQKDLMSSSWT